MDIASVKRWQWVAIALMVGPMLAFMNLQTEPGAGLRSMSGPEFDREIALKELPGEQPNLRNVVVHPAEAGAYGKPVYVVTLDRAVFDNANKGWRYQKSALQAEVPYVSYSAGRRGAGRAVAANADRTILTELNEVVAKNPTVKYQYAWWEEPKWAYSLWTAGSAGVIGGIWPVVLAMLVGAGLGPKVKEKEYDLERFGKFKEEEKKPEPMEKEMSEGDREKLTAQLDKLEKNIGSAAVMTDVPAGGGVAVGVTGPIRQLSGGPVEAMATAKEEEDKEYKGEFYPVAKTGQKG